VARLHSAILSARHLSSLALACAVFLALAAPASAETRQADAVLLARTLADGFTAIDARRPEVHATVAAWLADQGSCAKPQLRSDVPRLLFTSFRRQALHDVALRALAPELVQFVQRLRALPVDDAAIRGGIREVLLDYRNARALMKIEPPNLCRVVRALHGHGDLPYDLLFAAEDVRPARILDRRGKSLHAAQRALLRVEVDPRLARSLDSVFEHATAGLYRSRLETREPLAPPFPIVTDDAGLARLRAEAASVAAVTQPLQGLGNEVDRRIEIGTRRIARCDAAFSEALDRRPRGVFDLLTGWLFGEMAHVARHPREQFLADVAAVPVSDQAMRDLLARTSEQLAWIPRTTRVNVCSRLRAWRRVNWRRGAIDLGDFAIETTDSRFFTGIRLEDEEIDRAVLRRRGVRGAAAQVLLSPVDALLTSEPASAAYAARTQTLATRLRAVSAAVIARGAWRRPQATSAPATGSAGAR
jgi:hypothetical protein